MPLLWPPIALGLYFTLREFPFHFLRGAAFPWPSLPVHGWQRARRGPLLAVIAVAALTLPGLVYESVTLHRSVRSNVSPYALAPASATLSPTSLRLDTRAGCSPGSTSV